MACPVCAAPTGCECFIADPDGLALPGAGVSAAPFIVPTTVVAAGAGVTVTPTTSGLSLKKTTYTITAPAFSSAGASGVTFTAGAGSSAVAAYAGYSAPTPNRVAGQVQMTGNGAGGGTALVTVNFTTPYAAIPRTVVISALNSNAASANLYISGVTASGFTVSSVSGLGAAVVAAFSFIVIE